MNENNKNYFLRSLSGITTNNRQVQIANRQIIFTNRLSALKLLVDMASSELESISHLFSDDSKLDGTEEHPLPDKVKAFELELIKIALLRTNGNQRKACKLLGINATTLNAKLKRLGINPKDLKF